MFSMEVDACLFVRLDSSSILRRRNVRLAMVSSISSRRVSLFSLTFCLPLGFSASCSECLSSSPSSCLSCSSSDHLPLFGLCVSSNCTSSFVPYLQICLADLLTPASTRSTFPVWAIVLILLILLALFILGAWWYIRREREKTRQATLRFAHGLDEVKVQRKVWEVGVENVLGLMGRAREGMERRWRE